MITVCICGGRNFTNHGLIHKILSEHFDQRPIRLIHGDSRGVDRIAAQWGIQNGHQVVPYPADWDNIQNNPARVRQRRDGSLYNALAGIQRNQRMLDQEDINLLIAFPGQTGTADMVERASKAHIWVLMVTERGHEQFY